MLALGACSLSRWGSKAQWCCQRSHTGRGVQITSCKEERERKKKEKIREGKGKREEGVLSRTGIQVETDNVRKGYSVSLCVRNVVLVG